MLQYVLNDAIVIWRACLISGPKTRRCAILFGSVTLCPFVSLSLTQVCTQCSYPTVAELSTMIAAASSPICDIIYLPGGTQDWRWQFLIGMTYCLTLSANIWPTVLIGRTVWFVNPAFPYSAPSLSHFSFHRKHRKLLKDISHQGDGTTIAVLIILVESGALYCFIWVRNVQ